MLIHAGAGGVGAHAIQVWIASWPSGLQILLPSVVLLVGVSPHARPGNASGPPHLQQQWWYAGAASLGLLQMLVSDGY